jgi:hypothetical protein
MDHYLSSPLAVTLGFIDCINRGDVEGLGRLMAPDYQLIVFGERTSTGREAGIADWWGYATAYPRYLIHPSRIASAGQTVAVLGATTGSHLELPDEEELRLTLIWVAAVTREGVRDWVLIEDTPENRARHGLT